MAKILNITQEGYEKYKDILNNEKEITFNIIDEYIKKIIEDRNKFMKSNKIIGKVDPVY